MKFVKKHSYFLTLILGIIIALSSFLLYMFGIIESVGVSVGIILATIVFVFVTLIVIRIVRYKNNSNIVYDKKIGEFKDTQYVTSWDKLAFNSMKKSANVVYIIGAIFLVPFLLLDIIMFVNQEWGLFVLFLFGVIAAGIVPIVLGKTRKQNPEKYIKKFRLSFIPITGVNQYIDFIEKLFGSLIDEQFKCNREDLLGKGAIFYMNSETGTKKEWITKQKICPFASRYKNGNIAIMVNIYSTGDIVASLYNDNKDEEPINNLVTKVDEKTAKDFAVLMYTIADCKNFIDKNITELDFTYTLKNDDEIKFFN